MSLEPDPDTSVSHQSCSVIDKPKAKGSKPKEDKKQRSELRGNQGGLLEDQRQQFLSLVTVSKESSLQRTAHI